MRLSGWPVIGTFMGLMLLLGVAAILRAQATVDELGRLLSDAYTTDLAFERAIGFGGLRGLAVDGCHALGYGRGLFDLFGDLPDSRFVPVQQKLLLPSLRAQHIVFDLQRVALTLLEHVL